ncbi:MAG TPA: nucleotide disphospho-sugar-binding domain-containing protein [Sphingobium sp.]
MAASAVSQADVRPRILLAWEAGAGRGHIVTLRTVAEALGPAFAYDAALCVMDHAAELEPLCDLVFPGARLWFDSETRHAPGAPRTATWGEFLGDTGFRDGAFLATQVRWWQDVLTSRCTDLLVADYAPCALLAAQSLKIPAVVVGTGYGIPPAGLAEFPVFLPEYAERMFDEREMVATINAALTPLGVPPLRHLSDIYRRSQELVRTLDVLDPYAEARTQALLPPVADVARPADVPGDEIFVYFSTTELQDEAVVEALCSLNLPVRAFCPSITPDLAKRLEQAGIRMEAQPVPVGEIAARSRLIIHSGQHGILCLGLAAGLPQIAIPQHLEQLYHARRCEALGTGRVVTLEQRRAEEMRAMIRAAYADEGLLQTARDTARRLAPQFAVDPAAVIRERLLPLLPRS